MKRRKPRPPKHSAGPRAWNAYLKACGLGVVKNRPIIFTPINAKPDRAPGSCIVPKRAKR